jgi:hypothetical protein
MVKGTFRRRFLRALPGVLTVLVLHVAVTAHAAGDTPAGIVYSPACWEPDDREPPPRILLLGSDGAGADDGESSGVDRAHKIVGSSLIVSGLLMCSWGIASWEVEEYQCCPANNTGNVVKIVAGVMLFNAGLIYLLLGED